MRAVWICPKLCGCEIEMEGQFNAADLSNEGGRIVSHRHPVPFTAKDLVVIGVCVEHQPLLLQNVDEAQFLDENEEGDIVQNRGYLKLPVSTDAERLYMNLYGYSGQVWKPSTCGCELRQWRKRDGSEDPKVHRHPKEKRCKHHKNDTDDAQVVKAEQSLADVARTEILKTVADGEFSVKFDNQRKLMVVLRNKTKAVSDKVKADIEAKVGSGKVDVFGG